MSRVELRDLSKSFGAIEVIKGIDLTIEAGESGRRKLLKIDEADAERLRARLEREIGDAD